MLHVEIASEQDRPLWDEFVKSHAPAHHAYDWAWRGIINSAFGHTPYYLIARDDTAGLRGVFPAFLVRSVLFGRALISVPYLNAGGIIAADEEAFRALYAKACAIAAEEGATTIELRHRAQQRFASSLPVKSHKAAMILPLERDPEAVFKKFSAKLRSQIRRPAKSGVSASVSLLDGKMLQDFYSVFAENMRDLGTPVYPRSIFRLVAEHFGERARCICAYSDGHPVAAGITICTGNACEIPWASSLRRFNSLSANMLLYWEAIKDAALNGSAAFDFGRSTVGSGTYRFKEQWGAAPEILHWYYKEGTHVPDRDPKSSKFSALVWGWSHLPLPLANALGPWLTRSLP